MDPSSTNPTVAELAQRRGMDPVELMIDLAVETNLDQLPASTASTTTSSPCSATPRR